MNFLRLNSFLQITFGHLLRQQDNIDLHESGTLQLKELVPSEQHIQLHHRFAVVSVLMHLRGAYEGKLIDLSIRYTRIWAASPSGAMQITAGHASAMPSN
jgi:hypothetical protein